MGWEHGIVEGKRVGYAVRAKCEHPGCKAEIDRGLAYKCGNDIGSGDGFCNGFFCSDHLYPLGRGFVQVCQSCANDVARKQHRKLPFPNTPLCVNDRQEPPSAAVILGRVVEAGNVECLGGRPGLLIETTEAQLRDFGRNVYGCEVEVGVRADAALKGGEAVPSNGAVGAQS